MTEALIGQGAHRVVVLTSDEAILPEVQDWLASTFHITVLNSIEEMFALLEQVPVEAVVADVDTSLGSTEKCLAFIEELQRLHPDLVLMGFTRAQSKAVRRRALAVGIENWFVIPIDFQQLQVALQAALENRRREVENRLLQQEASRRTSFCDLIGGSDQIRLVYDAISRIADSNATVLIRGESGTGKELVARAIVTTGTRQEKPFISVNCAALPETLIEAELFGHEKGSFTGAHESRPGHIEQAHGGTLFLDEIGTIGLALQSKLLRVLEQRTVQRIGAKTSKKIDFRLITATNEDLEEAVHAGRFREDLYYRINVVPIFLPPLRERIGDIVLLVDHFLHLYCGANNVPLKEIDPEALEILEDYAWPGNVRELENLIQRLALMVSGQVISAKHLPQQILFASASKQESLLIPEEGISFDEEIARIEVAYLQAALRRTQGRKAEAARLLHIDPQKMKYLCRKYQIRVNN